MGVPVDNGFELQPERRREQIELFDYDVVLGGGEEDVYSVEDL